MYKQRTDYGTIRIGKAVIGRVIRDALEDFHKTVYLVNRKGSGMGHFGEPYKENAGSLIELSADEDKLDITIHIIIKFGESIKNTSEKMSAAIRRGLADRLEIEPQNLTIHILGVKSRDIAKRNISIRG